VTLTTPELVAEYGRRTQLPVRQVMMLVARCALVRRLAEEHFDRFILKGGALLYHVYGTQRVSFLDTDYADKTKGAPDPHEVEKTIVFKADGYELSTTPRGQWRERGYIVKGQNLEFSIDAFRNGRQAGTTTNISVSFRRSERLETPKQELIFDSDGLLTGPSSFKVNGLTLDEAAAEKILGWCLKEDLVKHLSDLALLARDHEGEIDRANVMALVAEKFARERNAGETRGLYDGLEAPCDLNRLFLAPERLSSLHQSWEQRLDTLIWLRPEEHRHPQSIVSAENIEALVRGFWAEAMDTLPTKTA
jgi:hypothetical protein